VYWLEEIVEVFLEDNEDKFIHYEKKKYEPK